MKKYLIEIRELSDKKRISYLKKISKEKTFSTSNLTTDILVSFNSESYELINMIKLELEKINEKYIKEKHLFVRVIDFEINIKE